jgi:predicted Zn-dependent peptidase
MPSVRSVAVGVFVGTGSRDETPEQAGLSHFLEHLLFKGTPTRSAREIAEAVDAVGGDMNAYTTKEYTSFYVRTLSRDLDLALDVLCDILRDPALRPDEVDAERQVILEELLMHLDEPADVAQERAAALLFPGHPLGRDVLGERDVVERVDVATIRSFFEEHYRPGNMVVAAAGDVAHEQVVAGVAERLAARKGGAPPRRLPPSPPAAATEVSERDSEQAHLVVAVRAPERRAPERYALAVLDHVLGGGVSSRLFQEIREARGLAYSVGSERLAYADSGALVVSVGTAPERTGEVLRLVRQELDRLGDEGVSPRELEIAKGHLGADLLLSLEDSGARMARIGSSLLLHDEVLAVDDVIERIEAVRLEDVASLAARVLRGPRVLEVVGPFSGGELPVS